MPRVLRKSKRRRSGYTEHHIQQLLTGFTIAPWEGFGYLHRRPHNGDRDGMKLAWEELRAELLHVWIRQFPGSRPYAWWLFDAPARRETSDGDIHPFDNPERQKQVAEAVKRAPGFEVEAYRLYYGMPNCLYVRPDFSANYETELQYLRRLDLLTDAERKELE